MKKLNLTLVFVLVSFLSYSYGQVIQNEENDTTKESSVMDAIRPPVDGTYQKIHIQNYKPAALPWLREADVYWSSLYWRVIDLREKFNFPLYYPTEKKGNWKSFMQSILDAIDSTESNPNPLRIYTDEHVNIPYSTSELKKNMGESKTIAIFDPETGEQIDEKVIFIDFGPKEVFRYVLYEQWRIDKQRSVMDQVIISICPMFWFEKEGGGEEDGGGGGGYSDYGNDDAEAGASEDEEEDLAPVPNKRWRNFGWIYYPELRPTMATTEVFNPANNAQRRNYDDLFLQRHFASFIKTEENVHDNRDINMYILNGMDQTLEAEKIKEKVRVREHDLWEF